MSEQDEREKLELRVRVAGGMVACPYLADPRYHVCTIASHNREGLCGEPCSVCKATPGRVYRFGDALRAACAVSSPYRSTKPHAPYCGCQGRGWVPAENFFALLLVELLRTGFAFRMETDTDRVVVWGPEGAPKVEFAFGADPELKTYRAVLAVVGAAEPDPDAGLEARPEVEERLLRSLDSPREEFIPAEEMHARLDEEEEGMATHEKSDLLADGSVRPDDSEVLEEAPGDYRRARGASPLPEGAEMPEETIRRLRGG